MRTGQEEKGKNSLSSSMPDTTATPSTSGSVQGIIEAAYTSTAQWFEQCTSTAIGGGGTATKSDSSSTFQHQQLQQQQQQHEEKYDEIHVVEQHASNGDARRDNAIVPSTLAKATNDDDDEEEDEEKTDETYEINDEPHPSSSLSSQQFTKVVEDALEGYSLSVCINPFWTTTRSSDDGSTAIANHTSTETQRSKQQKKKEEEKKKKHKKKKENHKPKQQQKCSDGNVGGHSTERKYACAEDFVDKSDDAVVTNDHRPTTPRSDTVVEPRTASCTIDGDHDDDIDDDIDDDEMDDTINSWATRGSVGTIQTNYTTTVGGNNTVMSSSVRSDTRSIHSFLMVNEPHRPSRTFSMTTPSNQPQSHSLSQRYTKPHNSPFTPSKHSSLLQSQRSLYQDKNNKRMSLASPAMALTESITETDEEVKSPTNNVLTPSLMQQIKHHLPFGRRDDSFWLQYSMVRDGASIGQLLRHVVDCNCRYSVLAVETMDGEIFGAYLSHSWEQPQPKHWYGGGESFL
eukprot:CAMPEP_0113499786 /NCGR_PEP_ID=MMETSP0014_2-20120614/31945_1 /TAXON_ID=2857 /ORGANISM="Nitzschia sp." /LENGTH=513 /DNA_ID=CAMNT_0000394007 /DNA_START=247 /DNA_END=1784 /DNA_ORIENTATION=+ /assembly_acc=CAM_ASM_000159